MARFAATHREAPALVDYIMSEDCPVSAALTEDDKANLSELYRRWPRSLADAAIALPQYLPEYIRYGLLAPNDAHSDYTGNEERVCRADRARFQSAFERLDKKSQTYLRKTIFDPDRCRAIFFSESY